MTVCDMILKKCKCECGVGPVKSKARRHRYKVRCRNCGRSTRYFRKELDAISAWQLNQVRLPEEVANEVPSA